MCSTPLSRQGQWHMLLKLQQMIPIRCRIISVMGEVTVLKVDIKIPGCHLVVEMEAGHLRLYCSPLWK